MSRKVLFVHDGPMGVYENQAYGISFKSAMIERYAIFGDEVTFLMRARILSKDNLHKYSKIDQPYFNFLSIPDFKSISTIHKTGEAKKIIKKAVKDNDVIVTRLPSAAGVIAFKEAKRLGKPVLVEFVACVYDALWNYDWRGKLIARYKFKNYQKLMEQATHTIYVTNEFLQLRYPSTGKSIGCSDVELKEIDDTVLRARLEKIKENKTPLKLATIAAIDVVYKGQADVIKAIAELKEKGSYFKYDIIGQGNPIRLQNLIKSLKVEDLVTIKGAIPHDEVFNVLRTIDIYIQPSKQEGLPRAVVEAMSVGCPIIGSNVGGIPELISKECIFGKGDVLGLSDLLSSVNEYSLLTSSQFNFEKSKEYQKELLENKRKAFCEVFMNDNNLQLK